MAKLRILPSPEDGLRGLIERAPQAEAWVDSLKEKARPTAAVLYGVRRRLATGGVVVLTVWLFAHVMLGANGMVVYRQKKAEYESLQKEIDGLQKENDSSAQQIRALQSDPKMIEKEAREQLHYARPGEVIYVSPAQQPPPVSESRTARK